MADGIAGPKTQAALPKDDISERREVPEKPGGLVLAEGELGVREDAGAGNNPRVVKLFAAADFCGIKQNSFAWCAAAVGAMLKRAGHKPLSSLAARFYEAWGVGLKKPALGAIPTKKRGNSSWQGQLVLAGARRLRLRRQLEPDLPARRQPGRFVVGRDFPSQGVHRMPLASRRTAACAAHVADDDRQGTLGGE